MRAYRQTSQLFNENRCSTNGINIALKIHALRQYEKLDNQANNQLSNDESNLPTSNNQFEGVILGALYGGAVGTVAATCLHPIISKRLNSKYESMKAKHYKRIITSVNGS